MENRYAYCQGDPINYFDPSGHISVWKVLGAVAGTVAAVALGAVTLGSSLAANITAAATCLGASEATASPVTTVTTGLISTAAGNVAGSLVSNAIGAADEGEWRHFWSSFLQDLWVGFAGMVAVTFISSLGT